MYDVFFFFFPIFFTIKIYTENALSNCQVNSINIGMLDLLNNSCINSKHKVVIVIHILLFMYIITLLWINHVSIFTLISVQQLLNTDQSKQPIHAIHVSVVHRINIVRTMTTCLKLCSIRMHHSKQQIKCAH